ncbi:MAG: hypothetical protein ACOVQS_05995 [Chitinophagaceae bacterium]
MNTTSAYPLSRLRDFGATISDTITFLKMNLKELVLMYVIFVAPFLLIATLLGADSFSEFFSGIGDDMGDFLRSLKDFGPMMLLSILMYILAAMLYPTLVYRYMRLYEEGAGQKPTIQQVSSGLFRQTLTNAGYSLLLIFGLIVSALIVIIPIIGFLVFFFGMIFLMINFTMLLPATTIENHSFPGGYGRAIRLVKGRWWYTFGVVIIILMISWFFTMIISFTTSMVFGLASVNFLDPDSASEVLTKKYFLVTGLSAILQQLFYLIPHVGMGIHFFSLREEKEAGGLSATLDTLGTDATPTTHPEEQF